MQTGSARTYDAAWGHFINGNLLWIFCRGQGNSVGLVRDAAPQKKKGQRPADLWPTEPIAGNPTGSITWANAHVTKGNNEADKPRFLALLL